MCGKKGGGDLSADPPSAVELLRRTGASAKVGASTSKLYAFVTVQIDLLIFAQSVIKLTCFLWE
jgi:hypothetical protein